MQVARDDNAYRDDVPDNGKLFPDGSKITKIEWFFEKNTVSPYFVTVPDTLKTVASAEAKGTKWDIIKNELDRDFSRLQAFPAANSGIIFRDRDF